MDTIDLLPMKIISTLHIILYTLVQFRQGNDNEERLKERKKKHKEKGGPSSFTWWTESWTKGIPKLTPIYEKGWLSDPTFSLLHFL